MTHYLIELAIWMLIAYFIGCLVGWVLRGMFAKPAAVQPVESVPAKEAPAYTPPPAPKPVVAPAPVAVSARPVVAPTPVAAAPRPAPVPVAAPVAGKMERPRGISAPRNGKADKLQRISGIGPKNEGILHSLGFFHFDQIAAWTSEHVTWVDDHLRFNGRINREEWIRQAALLAEGKEDEFSKQFGSARK